MFVYVYGFVRVCCLLYRVCILYVYILEMWRLRNDDDNLMKTWWLCNFHTASITYYYFVVYTTQQACEYCIIHCTLHRTGRRGRKRNLVYAARNDIYYYYIQVHDARRASREIKISEWNFCHYIENFRRNTYSSERTRFRKSNECRTTRFILVLVVYTIVAALFRI